MPHVIEPAASGRAHCRGCGAAIARAELRFGERNPSPFGKGGEGEATMWFHLLCAAYKRPATLLETLAALPMDAPLSAAERERLERAARASLAQRRIPRIDGAERAPSGQARCRACRQMIARGAWRIRLVYFEEGRVTPGGSVHLACGRAYFESDALLERILHFSPDLGLDERAELTRAAEAEVAPDTPPAPAP